MNNRKIRILGIAPYEGMKTTMQKLAAGREDLELDVYTGNLNEGVEIAKQYFNTNYDVIISRGGTAELIEATTSIPVVEISLSVYDMLRALKLAENYSDRYAIVGFSSITDSAHLLCDLLRYDMDIITLHSGDDVQAVLKSLKKKGCRMVVCDMITNTTAKKLGLNAILITSGEESIQASFDMAVKLSQSYAGMREENIFLNAVIQGNDTVTAVFDSTDTLRFSTFEKSGLNMADSGKLLRFLKKELSLSKTVDERKIVKTINGISYSIVSRNLHTMSAEYTAFYVRESAVSPASKRRGITISGKIEEEEKLAGSFCGITGIGGELASRIQQMSQSSQPVVVIGEEGTEHSYVIRSLYCQSPLSNNPIISIDFALCDDKGWDFLMHRYNSPFTDNNNTIVLKNIQVLQEAKQHQLLSAVRDTSLYHRNRLFLTCVCGPGGEVPAVAMDYIKTLSCLSISLLPLCKRLPELPDMISLYLGALNMEMAKQVIGLEDGAMELMKAYHWPFNYAQLERILRELVVITVKPYIQTADVEEVLKREMADTGEGTAGIGTVGIDMGKTLDEINQDVIQIALRETGGNQSAAAKRLGISRTTLWRLLKK